MAQLDPEVLEASWSEYRSSKSRESRNHLLLHYASVVRYVAAKVGAGLPSMVDRDDLVSYGQFGLMEALDSFDPERGVKFETFAVPRVRGSIFDELRKIDPVPRTVRARVRELEKVRSELQVELGREPTDDELAISLGLTNEAFRELQKMQHTSTYASLDEGEDQAAIADTTFDITSNPEDIFGVGEVSNMVAAAISSMPDRHKTILVLYYLEEMTFAEIGEVLGVTESRVCQLQTKVLRTLRDSLGHGALSAA